MKILVTNDDGIDSPGIYALVQALRRIGTVSVIAPDRQQSAVGHALTVSSPLRATPFRREGEIFGYAINGTPADCVKLGVSTLLEERPDIVVSGINHGQNTSVNILYSGTVSAATEATMMGLPAMAVSLDSFDHEADCGAAANWAARVAEKIPAMKLPKGTLLNLNIPLLAESEIKGLKITRQGQSTWNDSYERRKDPRGQEYFWLSGRYDFQDTDEDIDDVALAAGYVSLTPIYYRLTDQAFLPTLKDIGF